MTHDSNAMRLAGMIVLCIVTYFFVINSEAQKSSPGRVGPGAPECSAFAKAFGGC